MNILKNTHTAGLAIIFIGAFLPTGAQAQAQAVPARGPIPFATYDRDNNGLVSEDEFNVVRGERMSKTAAEGRPMRGAASAPSFSALDTDGDGQLSRDELATGQKAQMEKRRDMGQGRGQGRGMGNGMAKNMPAFSEFDLDGDGKIPEKEFYEARGHRISVRAQQGYQMRNAGNAPSFADIDVNGDGEISEAEFIAHQSLHRQQR